MRKQNSKDFSSQKYWETRYKTGKNSGAGSYGRLAEYKANFINDFCKTNQIESIIEFGSGDCNNNQLFEAKKYVGIDVSSTIIERSREKYAGKDGWDFYTTTEYAALDSNQKDDYDVSMSLDVIYHLVEDDIYNEYMEILFGGNWNFVILYASDEDKITNDVHVRHRSFSAWIAQNKTNWELISEPENPFHLSKGGNQKNSSFASFKVYRKSL